MYFFLASAVLCGRKLAMLYKKEKIFFYSPPRALALACAIPGGNTPSELYKKIKKFFFIAGLASY